MTEHTKEPWKIGSSHAGKSVVFLVGDEPDHTLGPDENWIDCNTEANARRIVACVNYCKGLPTEGMETATAFGKPAEVSLQQLVDTIAVRDQLKASLDKLVDKAVEIEQQRDQLLAALETLVEAHDTECSDTDRRWALVDTRLAIAAVKGDHSDNTL